MQLFHKGKIHLIDREPTERDSTGYGRVFLDQLKELVVLESIDHYGVSA
jgi:hypothetical protein